MSEYTQRGQMQVDSELADFVESEVLPGLGYDAQTIWKSLEDLLTRFTPQNSALLQKRVDLKSRIDDYNKNEKTTPEAYRTFLEEIGYLAARAEPFEITTTKVDRELANMSGPQLVVPVSNARYVLNAVNARWGSLYDALYGTDAIMPVTDQSQGYDTARGDEVIVWAKSHLDQHWPLDGTTHGSVTRYFVQDGKVLVETDAGKSGLKDASGFVGYKGSPEDPSSILLSKNGLQIEIKIDRTHSIGSADLAGVSDVFVESAVTTIVDFEDSVAAVDGEDKTLCYRNWLGLMKGDLSATFKKSGHTISRKMNEDLEYTGFDGTPCVQNTRSKLLVRNVGHLMTTPAVLMPNGEEAFEGLLDAFLTSLIACHDLHNSKLNAAHGSVYIVKPKMHGPEEAAFANDVLDCVEDMLGLDRNTLKIGLMDEERRTSVNLSACIYELKNRIIFINTGFLDRTGDEINTSMFAGAMVRKSDMAHSSWLPSYERQNVDCGLSAGFRSRAQIGKGMWAKPDYMSAMLAQKDNHPKSGASCAWVPSPTAATLHALHYHSIDVQSIQISLEGTQTDQLDALLTPPLAGSKTYSEADILEELRNCCQGILGYVVRWIDHGVGCSKVPDINDVGLMEDRATLRISCQLLANWLEHGICSPDQIQSVMREMAVIVDQQNADDPAYCAMSDGFDGSIAFQSSIALVLEGADQPNGYTEPILHRARRRFKSQTTA